MKGFMLKNLFDVNLNLILLNLFQFYC